VIEKRTGRLVARDGEHIGPKIFHSTWSSPSLGVVNGRPRIFFAGGNGVIYGFEPLEKAPPAGEVATLKKVWEFDFDPAAPKENVHQFNSNRQESPSNIYGMPAFHQNSIYVAGGGDLWWGKHEAWLKRIDATGTGNVSSNALVWSRPLERHTMGTVAALEELVFVTDCTRHVHCLDRATGNPHWVHEARGDFFGSTLAADGKIYAGSKRGELLIFKAAREKQLLATVEMGAAINSTPVAANGVLYVATMKQLFALEKK
jgi:outer membrane protein assembly factor BamB